MLPRGGGCVELCWVVLSCVVLAIFGLVLFSRFLWVAWPCLCLNPKSTHRVLGRAWISTKFVQNRFLEDIWRRRVIWWSRLFFIRLIQISPKSNCICNDSEELKENNLFHANQVPISNMPSAVFYLDFLWRLAGIDLFSYLIWRWKVCLSWSNHGDRRLDAR